jgi:hypothetical protein
MAEEVGEPRTVAAVVATPGSAVADSQAMQLAPAGQKEVVAAPARPRREARSLQRRLKQASTTR